MISPARRTTIRGGPGRPGRPRALESVRARTNRALLGLEQLEERSLAAASITEVAIPTGGSNPMGITTGPDGALWFTELGNNQIGRVTTSGVVTEFQLPTPSSGPWELVSASDGAIWFTENSANKIGRITTSGAITEYPIPTSNSRPQGITAGPDGALWFTENSGRKIGRITTSGAITEYSFPSGHHEPEDIAVGPDGALWFTDRHDSSIGRITTSGVVSVFDIPNTSDTHGSITSGPDGAVWFTETDNNRIGRITTSGSLTTFPIPGGDKKPAGITVGPDGALWFTESSASGNGIGRITTSGVFTDTTIATNDSRPLDITLGPDGALWFAEKNGGKIGRLSVSSTPPITVDQSPTSAVVVASRNSADIGQSVTFTATVSGPSGTPAGTVTFLDGTTVLGTAPLSAGTARFTTSSLPAGSHAITARYEGDGQYLQSASGPVAVTVDASLEATGTTFQATAGTGFSTTVATFDVEKHGRSERDFTAVIDWGDGTTSPGTVRQNGNSHNFKVLGSHSYAGAGTYTVAVGIFENGVLQATATSRAVVSGVSVPWTASGKTFAAVEDSPFTTVVASFTGGDPSRTAADFSATINWGNGRSSAGVVVRDPQTGAFNVVGTSTYPASGTYNVRVTIRANDGSSVTARSLAVVSSAGADRTLTAAGLTIAATAGVAFAGPVGSFVDDGLPQGAGSYAVTIDWGDGTTSTGSISAVGRTAYLVAATHTYAAAGQFSVSFVVAETSGALAAAISPAVVVGVGGTVGAGEPPVVIVPNLVSVVPQPSVVGSPSGLPVVTATVTASTTIPPTAVGAPFVPPLPAIGVPALVPTLAPTVVPPATVPAPPQGVATQVGQGSAPAAVPVQPGRSNDGPATNALPAAGASAPGPKIDEQGVELVMRPIQEAEVVVADATAGMVRAWLNAVAAAGDEAGAVTAALGRAPTPVTASSTVDVRGERDFPRELLWRELDELDKDIATGSMGEAFQQVFGAAAVAYVGYVLLSSRGGFWLLSLLMARPLWKEFDPLQILLAWDDEQGRKTDAEDEAEETLQTMVDDDLPAQERSKGSIHVAHQPGARQPHRELAARRPRPASAPGPRRRGARRAKSAL